MTIQQIIKKAIDAGYELKMINLYVVGAGTDVNKIKEMADNFDTPLADIFLDPLFWESLGKALGWKLDNCDMKFGAEKSIHCSHCHFGPTKNCNEWLYQWHSFIDHLANGGTVEEFFKQF